VFGVVLFDFLIVGSLLVRFFFLGWFCVNTTKGGQLKNSTDICSGFFGGGELGADCMCVYARVCGCSYVWLCMCVCVCDVYTHVCVLSIQMGVVRYVYVCVCVYVWCVCMCVLSIQRDR
jgi:hypothetical protein